MARRVGSIELKLIEMLGAVRRAVDVFWQSVILGLGIGAGVYAGLRLMIWLFGPAGVVQ